MVGQRLGGERPVPEALCAQLAGEALVFNILCAQHFGPLACKLQAHAFKLIAGAGEDEGGAAWV